MHLKWLPLELHQLQLQAAAKATDYWAYAWCEPRWQTHRESRAKIACVRKGYRQDDKQQQCRGKEWGEGIEQRSLLLTGGVVLRKWLQASRSAFNAFWGQPRALCLCLEQSFQPLELHKSAASGSTGGGRGGLKLLCRWHFSRVSFVALPSVYKLKSRVAIDGGGDSGKTAIWKLEIFLGWPQK